MHLRGGIPLVFAAALLASPVSSGQSLRDLAAGKDIYERNCFSCHGEDGDSLNYANISPIAGISRRHPPAVVGAMAGVFSGRFFYGEQRKQLVAYLGVLPGAKGFVDPGWLISPVLTEKKALQIKDYRVIDLRGNGAYAVGHIANAVSPPPLTCPAPAGETALWLAQAGVTPATTVVLYGQQTGPAAACAWWNLRRAGHQWAAVLDGGWERWARERRLVLTNRTRVGPAEYPQPASRPQVLPEPAAILRLGPDGWDWRATQIDGEFRPAEELRRLAAQWELAPGRAVQLSGPPEEIAHLVLTLSLLGWRPEFDEGRSVLFLPAAAPPGEADGGP